MTDRRRLRRLARHTFGFEELRPGQEEAIRSVADGRDTLAVLPTGWGKSAIYQLAALVIPGPTLVVSPLVALQRDQVANLTEAGVEAAAVNSDVAGGERGDAFRRFVEGSLEFLFVSPEQLARDDVVEVLGRARVSLFVVDEAHCVSSWGHDFRPDYLRLAEVVQVLGRPPVLALTATASPAVRADILDRLRMRDAHLVAGGFDRPNIHLDVERFVDADEKRRALVERTLTAEGSGLVYVATRKAAEEVAADLANAGSAAEPYHAGLRDSRRRATESAFLAGELEVVVATTAFGMGIDKPDVRFVHHHDPAESLDAYYQEIGRAGRDGEPASAVLFYRPEDLGVRRFFASNQGLGHERLRSLARAVEGSGSDELDDLGRETGLSLRRLVAALDRLEQAGGDPAGAAELEEAHTRMEQSRVEMVRAYAESRGCRRQVLLGYFGEQILPPCSGCDRCDAGLGENGSADVGAGEPAFPVESWVRHAEWGRGQVIGREGDKLTVLFESSGYRTLSVSLVEERNLLVTEPPVP